MAVRKYHYLCPSYGAGHLVTATFGQPPIWPRKKTTTTTLYWPRNPTHIWVDVAPQKNWLGRIETAIGGRWTVSEFSIPGRKMSICRVCNARENENREPLRHQADFDSWRTITSYLSYLIASAASNHWLRVKGPDKQIQIDVRKWASGNFLNGLYLSKYLLPTLKILDLGGDW